MARMSPRRLGRSWTWLAGVLVIAAAFAVVRPHITPGEGPGFGRGDEAPCVREDPGCPDGGTPVVAPSGPTEAPEEPVLRAAEVCPDAGYLCAALAAEGAIHIRRWRNGTGTLVVRVPRPTSEDATRARELQRAAVRGIRAWNGRPFPIRIDTRGRVQAQIEVRWVPSLGGRQIGRARTAWRPGSGLVVLSLDLVTRSPFNPRAVVSPEQLRLTAAHEMGHALGLPHSDSKRDVMYPTNTATSLTARDYRTMEALYALPDGAVIHR